MSRQFWQCPHLHAERVEDMRKRGTTRGVAVLRAGALLLLACGPVGCSEGRRELTLQLEFRLGPTERQAEALLLARAVLEKRLALIVPDARVLSAEPDRLLVQVPDQEAAALETLRSVIQNTGHLEFRPAAPDNSEPYRNWLNTGKAPPGWTEYAVRSFVLDKYEDSKILVSDRARMTGENIAEARVEPMERGRPGASVRLSFRPAGEREFARVTGDHVGERLAIVLNTQRSADGKIKERGVCYSAPVIMSRIFGDAVIEGDFTQEQAKALAAVLTGGSLPAPLVFDKVVPLSKNPPRDGAEKK